MTRLFVAAWPSPTIVAQLRTLTADRQLDGGRRVREENWHVTLRFIGSADVDEVSAQLAAARLPRVLAQLGPTVIDLDSRQIVVPIDDVDNLAAAVATATAGFGEPAAHAFRGHITLARVKPRPSPTNDQRSERSSPSERVSTLLGEPVTGSFTIEEVALVSSDTRPSGAVYDTIATFPTTPSAG